MLPGKCKTEGCSKAPEYGTVWSCPIKCLEHKTRAMAHKLSPKCQEPECNKYAFYSCKGESAKYCNQHKTNGMKSKARNCISADCNIKALYNYKNVKPEYCSAHKKENMVDVHSKTCNFEECYKRPIYGIPGKIQEFCNAHKTKDMVAFRNSKCKYLGCDKTSIYGNKNEKPKFCSEHKTKDMLILIFKICAQKDCEKRARYGEKGKGSEFCREHRKDHMINPESNCCQEKDCKITFAVYDVIGGKGSFCSVHKKTGMINVFTKFCEVPNCSVGATFGEPGKKISSCFNHRQPGMIRRPSGKCVSCSCPAIWGINSVPKHCDDHKIEGEQNLTEKPCLSCGLMYILDAEGKCEMCNPIKWAKMRLLKQNALMAYLDNKDLKGDQTDKTIDGGACGKERPDRLYDFGDKIVILECDENQHQERSCLCEQTRMINIAQSLGGIPVYFIRWNPDDYTSDKEPESLKNRYKTLSALIVSIKENRIELPKTLVSAFYMYFDGWTSYKNESWHVITGPHPC